MKKNTIAILLVASLLLSIGYLAYDSNKGETEIRFPISAKRAMEILESDAGAKAFIMENLANESGRMTRVNLKWNPETDTYVWDIELMERTCGCKVGAIEGLNVLSAQIDPITGDILNITTRTGVKEEALSKERCMEGCHKPSEVPGLQIQNEV